MHTTALTIESHDQSQDDEEHTISLFSNPQNFTVQDSRFIAHHTTNITHASGSTALDILLSRAAHSATYNSKDRSFDTPKCDEDTRVGLIEEIMEWAQDAEVPSKLLCLTGSAGSGKSAIAQTISETCATKGCLGASFFFSIVDSLRNNPDRFVASLAYQISRSMDGVEKHILRAVEKDPAIFKMSLETQVEALLVIPVLQIAHSVHQAGPFIIVVDGLDECRGEQHQAQVIRVLHTCVTRGLPFRIFVTSRPEYAIRSALASTGDFSGFYHIILNEYDATEDIRLYLFRRLQAIGRAHGGVEPWPPDNLVQILVEDASGQFIYASTVVKFIGDRRRSPFRRLQIVVDWVRKPDNQKGQNPFATLDALYTNILSAARAAYDELSESDALAPLLTQRLLSLMVIDDLNRPGDPSDYQPHEQFLLLDEGESGRIVEDLHSVIRINRRSSIALPSQQGIATSFYHKSFLDYLLDPGRCQSFYVPPTLIFVDLAIKSLDRILAANREGVLALSPWASPNLFQDCS
ncbi:hypothetical protein H1R20_g9122, partial [Candolleomyces eurysporus]